MYKAIGMTTAVARVYVCGAWASRSRPRGGRDAPGELADDIARALRTPGFEGELGQAALGGSRVLVLGMGKKADLDHERMRVAGAHLCRKLDAMQVRSACLDFSGDLPSRKLSEEDGGRSMAEGLGLANWRVDFFDGTASRTASPISRLSLSTPQKAFRAGMKAGLLSADCTNAARRIAATPPNICQPRWLSAEVRRLCRGTGLHCRVINHAECARLGMGGLVSVGKGSRTKPCLVIMKHRPRGHAGAPTLALVGKSITFDTGGYSLKTGGTMKGMKYDANGGCAVIGAMLLIAARQLPLNVIGILPIAENMVGPDAYRPDDIVRMHNGVSVEVTNTDAEGRLVLGDALAYACKQYKPDAIVDIATLTGGVVVALGEWCAGLWCNDDSFYRRMSSAAERTGERVWRMPLWDAHRDFMRAHHADIWNSGPKRDAHPIQGAAFLSFFVDDDLPWAHIDIAGVSATDRETPLHDIGPTGFGVRLLADLAGDMSAG